MTGRPHNLRDALSITGRAVKTTVHSPMPGARRNRGVALIIVLVVVAIMTVVSTEFVFNQRANMWMGGNITAHTQGYWNARGAMKIAVLAINARQNFPQVKTALAIVGRGRGQNIEIWRQACEFTKIFCTGRAEFFGMDLLDFTEEDAVGLKRGSCSCEVSAEDGRVNLNAAATDAAAVVARAATGGSSTRPLPTRTGPGGQVGTTEQQRNRLGLDLFGLLRPMMDSGELDSEEEIIDIILNVMDWTDADEEKTDVDPLTKRFVTGGGGGEGGDYGQWGYENKNAKMDTVGEVQLIEGMSTEVFCKLRDKLTVFATDKINVNDAPLETVRGILCEAINDEALRMEYCYNPFALILQPIDQLLIEMEKCRQLKKAVFSTPFSSMPRFHQFLKAYPAVAALTSPVPFNPNAFNQSVVNQHLGVLTKMVRVTATGTFCWDNECSGECIGGDAEEDTPREPRQSEKRSCKQDSDCGGGYCSRRESVRHLTAIIDTSTGSIVHYRVD